MEEQEIRSIFTEIGEGEGDVAIKAAKKLINRADDGVLKVDIMNFTTKLLSSKDSITQDEVQVELMKYIKTQMALVYVQAFRGGRSHQIMLQNEQTQRLIGLAQRMNENEKVNENEFTLPTNCPIEFSLSEGQEDPIEGRYQGVTEDGERVVLKYETPEEGEMTIELEWSQIQVDKIKVAKFIQDNDLTS